LQCLLGDSAGGNFAAATTLRILSHNYDVRCGNSNGTEISLPCGLILLYPNLDFTMTSWMSEDQLQVIKSESLHDVTDEVMKTKRDYSRRKSVLQAFDEEGIQKNGDTVGPHQPQSQQTAGKRKILGTQLAMTSRSAFVQDRIISTDLVSFIVLQCLIFVDESHGNSLYRTRQQTQL
jgi:hypothetical protein